jgi:hypothetical protein
MTMINENFTSPSGAQFCPLPFYLIIGPFMLPAALEFLLFNKLASFIISHIILYFPIGIKNI